MSDDNVALRIQAFEDREQIRDVVSTYGFLHDKLQLKETRDNQKNVYEELLKEWEGQFSKHPPLCCPARADVDAPS